MLAGWGVAQWPYLLPTSLTVTAAAGAPRTLGWVVVAVPDRRRHRRSGAGAAVRSRPAQPAAARRERSTGEARDQRHRVVVVGGGFGGLFATRALGWSPVDVTLVDREPHHLFQPMLYQVATGIVSEGEIAPSLRHVLRFQENAAVLLAEVTGFDLAAPRGRQARRPDGAAIALPYDSLIVAAGAGMLLLRPRRAGRARARHEDARRRAPSCGGGCCRRWRWPSSPRIRQAAGRLADGGHRRRRRDRRRDRRPDPGAGRARARHQLPADRSRRACASC